MKSKFEKFMLIVFSLSIILNIQFIIITELKKDNHSIKFEWEGLEKDIPKEGYIQISGINNNTIYLNAIDE